MAVILSLISAAIFGAGDFAGGLATKRTRVIEVVAGSHLVGLVGVALVAVFFADEFIARDFALGAAAGAFGGLGVALLYRRLAVGPMSVVAPLTAITSAAVPAAWGAATGDSLSRLAWVGVAVALVAIGAISRSGDDSGAPVTAPVIIESLGAGAGFGAFFILIDATDAASSPWPVVGARLLTAVLLGGLVLSRPRLIESRDRATLGLIALTGVLDTGSNVIFLYATNIGDLTVVSVLSSFYPASTVLLARFVLGERMTSLQGAGFVLAIGATVLIALG